MVFRRQHSLLKIYIYLYAKMLCGVLAQHLSILNICFQTHAKDEKRKFSGSSSRLENLSLVFLRSSLRGPHSRVRQRERSLHAHTKFNYANSIFAMLL